MAADSLLLALVPRDPAQPSDSPRDLWLVNTGPEPVVARVRIAGVVDLNSGPVRAGEPQWIEVGEVPAASATRLRDDVGWGSDLCWYTTVEVGDRNLEFDVWLDEYTGELATVPVMEVPGWVRTPYRAWSPPRYRA